MRLLPVRRVHDVLLLRLLWLGELFPGELLQQLRALDFDLVLRELRVFGCHRLRLVRPLLGGRNGSRSGRNPCARRDHGRPHRGYRQLVERLRSLDGADHRFCR